MVVYSSNIKTMIPIHVRISLCIILFLGGETNASNTPVSITESKVSTNHQIIPIGRCENMSRGLLLNLKNVGLQRIDSDFANSRNVSCLNFEDNEISYVSPSAFRLMPNLLYLNLARNRIDLANFAQLNSHLHLRTLILDENHSSLGSEGLKLEFLNTFPRLLYLYLRNCGIKEIASLSFAPRLSHLFLSSNSLENSESFFLDDVPASLISIDIADSGIKSLNVRKLAGVQKLRLDGNQIKRVCSKSYCQDSALILEAATGLQSFSMSKNDLSSIEPDAFENSENLRDLDLSYNQIDSIRKGTFDNLPNLRNLTLRNNLLSEMPDLCSTEELQYLSLANNRLETVKSDSFCIMKKLRFVDLSSNRIRILEAGAFANQARLDTLYLSNNFLKNFPDSWLTPLKSLRLLYIDNNHINSLDDLKLVDLQNNSNLKHIFLQNNRITKLSTSVMYNISQRIPTVFLEMYDSSNDQNDWKFNNSETNKCDCNCDYSNRKTFVLDE